MIVQNFLIIPINDSHTEDFNLANGSNEEKVMVNLYTVGDIVNIVRYHGPDIAGRISELANDTLELDISEKYNNKRIDIDLNNIKVISKIVGPENYFVFTR